MRAIATCTAVMLAYFLTPALLSLIVENLLVPMRSLDHRIRRIEI
jgi:hypothetical protein